MMFGENQMMFIVGHCVSASLTDADMFFQVFFLVFFLVLSAIVDNQPPGAQESVIVVINSC